MSLSLVTPEKKMRYPSANMDENTILTIVNNERKNIVPDSSAILNPLISVRNLNVFIQKNHILKDVNLDLPNKAITCIIGPSGCGKTTLLKTFNRLLENSSEIKITGEVLVDGENIHDSNIDVTHIRKKMGLLSQRPCPLPMSIYDNIAYGPKIHGIRNE